MLKIMEEWTAVKKFMGSGFAGLNVKGCAFNLAQSTRHLAGGSWGDLEIATYLHVRDM